MTSAGEASREDDQEGEEVQIREEEKEDTKEDEVGKRRKGRKRNHKREKRCLVGLVRRVHDSLSQGCEFEPHPGCRDYK